MDINEEAAQKYRQLVAREITENDFYIWVYDTFFDRLVRFLVRHYNVQKEESEDIVQEAMIKCLKWKLPDLTQKPLLPWIAQQARWIFLTRWKKAQLHQEIPLDESPANYADLEKASIEKIDLIVALSALSIRNRQLILRHMVFGVPYQQLADEYGLEYGTVARAVSRARAAMRAVLSRIIVEE